MAQLVTLDDYLRAPWMHDRFPLRMRVTQVTTSGPRLWVAMPIHRGVDRPPIWSTRRLGRREVDLPILAVIAATWREAMDFALTGASPTPVEDVYPHWCGVAA